MHRLGIAIICLVLLMAGLFYFFTKQPDPAQQEDFYSWQEFTPRSGLFKITLPHFPQYAKDFVLVGNSDQKLRYDMYASEKIDGTLFLINIITYPESSDMSFTDDILHHTLDELMRSKSENHLVHFEKGVFQQYPALNFSIENRSFHIEGKILIVDKRVYVLTYTTYKDNFDPKEYQYFINSFRLMDKNDRETNTLPETKK